MRQRTLHSLGLAIGATVLVAASSLACSSSESDTGSDGGGAAPTGTSPAGQAGQTGQTGQAGQTGATSDAGKATASSDAGASRDSGGSTTSACAPVVAPASACATTKVSYGVPLRLQWPGSGNFNVSGLVAHDMNDDGRVDIVAQESPNGVDVYLSHGDGTFATPVHYDADIEGNDSVTAGDFDGDCIADVITTNAEGSLSFFKGKGDGTLAPETQTPGPGTGLAMLAHDLNDDGKLDYVVQGGSFAVVGLNEGSATFAAINAPWSVTNAGGYLDNIDIGDIDGNGSPDIVFGDQVVDGTGAACFLPNSGNGSFGAAKCVTVAPGANAKKPAVGDFDGNGKLDIAVKTDQADTASVFLGNGDGTFQTRTDYPIVGERAFRAVDVNNDGKPDLAAYDAPNSVINVLVNNGDGTFATTPMVLPGGGPSSQEDEPMVIGDFMGNGLPAIAVNDRQNGSIDVVLATCKP